MSEAENSADMSVLVDELHKCKQMYEEIEEIVISNMETNNNSMLDLIKSLKIVSHNQNVLENKLEDTLKNQMNTDLLVNNMNQRLNNLTNLFSNKNFKKMLIRQVDGINDQGPKSGNNHGSNETVKLINSAISILDPTIQTKSNTPNKENIKRGPGRPKKDPSLAARTTENIDLFKGKSKLPTGNTPISKSKRYFINPIDDDDLNKLTTNYNNNDNNNIITYTPISSGKLSSIDLKKEKLPSNKTIAISESKTDLSETSDQSGSEDVDAELESELDSELESESENDDDDDENDEDYHYNGKGRPRKAKNRRVTRRSSTNGNEDKNTGFINKFKINRTKRYSTRNRKTQDNDDKNNSDRSDNDDRETIKNENGGKLDIPQISDTMKRRRGRPQKKRIVETFLNNSLSPMENTDNTPTINDIDDSQDENTNDKDKTIKGSAPTSKPDIKFSNISINKSSTADTLNNSLSKRSNSSKGKTPNRQDMVSTTLSDIDPKQDILDKLRDPTDKMLVNMKYNDRITTRSFMESNRNLLLALKEEERRKKIASSLRPKVEKKKGDDTKKSGSFDSIVSKIAEDTQRYSANLEGSHLHSNTAAITDGEKKLELATENPPAREASQNSNKEISSPVATKTDQLSKAGNTESSRASIEIISIKKKETGGEKQTDIDGDEKSLEASEAKKAETSDSLNRILGSAKTDDIDEEHQAEPNGQATNPSNGKDAQFPEGVMNNDEKITSQHAETVSTTKKISTPVKRRPRKQVVLPLKSHYNLRNKKRHTRSTSDVSDLSGSEEEPALPKRKRRTTKKPKADDQPAEQPNIISQAMPLPVKMSDKSPDIEEEKPIEQPIEQPKSDAIVSKTEDLQPSIEEIDVRADSQSSADNKTDLFSSILFGAPVELLCKDGFFYRRDKPDLPIKAGEYLDLKLRSKYEEVVKTGKLDDLSYDINALDDNIANPMLYAISVKYKSRLGKKDRTTAQTLSEQTENETAQTFELLGETVLTEKYVNSLEYFLMEFYWENKLVSLGLKLKESKRTWQRRRALFTLFEFWRDQTIEKRNFKKYTMFHAVKEMENYRIFINRSVSWFYNHITLLKMILYDLCDNIDSQWREWMFPRDKPLPIIGSYDEDLGVEITADNIVSILDKTLVLDELDVDSKHDRLAD